MPAKPKGPPVWPTVIGIIGIIWAAFGVLGGIGGMCSPLIMKLMAGLPGAQTQFELSNIQKALTVGVGALGMLAAILLLIAAIKLLGRKGGARKLLLVWAVLKILVVAVQAMVTYTIQQAQFQSMGPTTSGMPPQMFNVFGNMSFVVILFTVLFQILWGWALPLFVLVWFTRKKFTEEMAGWE